MYTPIKLALFCLSLPCAVFVAGKCCCAREKGNPFLIYSWSHCTREKLQTASITTAKPAVFVICKCVRSKQMRNERSEADMERERERGRRSDCLFYRLPGAGNLTNVPRAMNKLKKRRKKKRIIILYKLGLRLFLVLTCRCQLKLIV